ncbi:hypothetical protein ABMA58_00165 [Oceanospirillum sp. HFRX-1_2]
MLVDKFDRLLGVAQQQVFGRLASVYEAGSDPAVSDPIATDLSVIYDESYELPGADGYPAYERVVCLPAGFSGYEPSRGLLVVVDGFALELIRHVADEADFQVWAVSQ